MSPAWYSFAQVDKVFAPFKFQSRRGFTRLRPTKAIGSRAGNDATRSKPSTWRVLVMQSDRWDGSPPPGEPPVAAIPMKTRAMWWEGVTRSYVKDGAVIDQVLATERDEAIAEVTKSRPAGSIGWLVVLDYASACAPTTFIPAGLAVATAAAGVIALPSGAHAEPVAAFSAGAKSEGEIAATFEKFDAFKARCTNQACVDTSQQWSDAVVKKLRKKYGLEVPVAASELVLQASATQGTTEEADASDAGEADPGKHALI